VLIYFETKTQKSNFNILQIRNESYVKSILIESFLTHPAESLNHLNSPCELLNNNVVHLDMLNITMLSRSWRSLQNVVTYWTWSHVAVPATSIFPHKKNLMNKLILVFIVKVYFHTRRVLSDRSHRRMARSRNCYKLHCSKQYPPTWAKQLEISNKAIEVLQHNVKILRNAIKLIEEGLTNVKRYQPSSILATSYLTSLPTDWNFILKETTRKWQDHKLHAPFFDYLNFSPTLWKFLFL
jgi:hypothetical protein